MTKEDNRAYGELYLAIHGGEHVVDMNVISQFMISFFDDLERHQGRMLKKRRCAMARQAAYIILKERNALAVKYNDLARKYRTLKELDADKTWKG